MFGKDGTDPKDIGLNNQGSIDGIEYAKTWYAKWPKGLQDTKAAANSSKHNSKKVKQLLSSMVLGKLLH